MAITQERIDRRYVTRTHPASVKQIQFIGTLAQRVNFADTFRSGLSQYGTYGDFFRAEWQSALYNGELTTRDASFLIDTLKAAARSHPKRDEAAETGEFVTTDTGKFYDTVEVFEVVTKDDYRIVKATVVNSGGVQVNFYDSSYGGQFTEGQQYTIQARIKAHKVYRNQKYTQLNYVKVKH